jgi:hypothetical protein
MFRLAIAATCVSALMLFIYSNTVLALTTGHYCVVLFELPLTDKSYQLPNWMWGLCPISVWAISSVSALGLWMALGIKRLRTNRTVKEHHASAKS